MDPSCSRSLLSSALSDDAVASPLKSSCHAWGRGSKKRLVGCLQGLSGAAVAVLEMGK